MFLRQSGVVVGTVRHVPDVERLPLVIELISTEALKTSEIEGEILDRDSVQSSLRRQFGLHSDAPRSAPAEQGISELLADLYRRWGDPLDDGTLFQWHQWLMQGRTDLRTIGDYRKHPDRPDRSAQGPLRGSAVLARCSRDGEVLSLVQ